MLIHIPTERSENLDGRAASIAEKDKRVPKQPGTLLQVLPYAVHANQAPIAGSGNAQTLAPMLKSLKKIHKNLKPDLFSLALFNLSRIDNPYSWHDEDKDAAAATATAVQHIGHPTQPPFTFSRLVATLACKHEHSLNGNGISYSLAAKEVSVGKKIIKKSKKYKKTRSSSLSTACLIIAALFMFLSSVSIGVSANALKSANLHAASKKKTKAASRTGPFLPKTDQDSESFLPDFISTKEKHTMVRIVNTHLEL